MMDFAGETDRDPLSRGVDYGGLRSGLYGVLRSVQSLGDMSPIGGQSAHTSAPTASQPGRGTLGAASGCVMRWWLRGVRERY